MFVPVHFRNTNLDEVEDFVRKNSFGVLMSNEGNNLFATHIPLELDPAGKFLHGHVSKANPQGKRFRDNEQVLAIFTGPHTYISSSWYDHENVPTWNYIAVHIYGKVRVIEGQELYASLKHLVDKYEHHSAHPVSLETMTPEYLSREMKGIIGFEITIERIEAAFKLSQNRDGRNFKRIIDELEQRGDHASVQVADAMKKIRNQ